MWDYIVEFVHWIIGKTFYAVGRGVMRLFGFGRSESGAAEAMVGFLLILGLVMALVKLPVRATAWGLALMR